MTCLKPFFIIPSVGDGGRGKRSSALKSGPVPVLLPFLEEPEPGPVLEILKM